ncbi:MAG: Ku protein [Thermoanaerobacteraceae bacterium]|jgi:DNA end-binding protein Ku|nr:Ku protein [Thermoanaerobacteraceae bacterium]
MRPIWKGAVTFGLVYIPVKVYAAIEEKDVKFHLLHSVCRTPVRYRRYCPVCERDVGLDEVVRGYEYEKGRYVVLTEEDLENLPGLEARNVALLDFVGQNEVSPLYYAKNYYLTPAEGGERVYELLRQAMERTNKAAVGRVAVRTKQSPALLWPSGRALVLSTLHYPDEVRSAAALPELNYSVQVHENELKMAESLIASLTAPFDPGKYRDEYREALLGTIGRKMAGEEVVAPPPRAEKVVDLMEALKQSIELAKKEREAKRRGARG